MKTERRLAREFALQALFHREVNQPTDTDQAFDDFWSMFQRCREEGTPPIPGVPEASDSGLPDKPREGVRVFAEELVRGTLGNMADVDRLIEASADNWRLDRMSAVDRNILRLAVFETRFFAPPTPPAVVIDEAVELAKRYGTVESGRFVNGILDHIFRDDLKSLARESSAEDESP
jgi:N utilization substance protein B